MQSPEGQRSSHPVIVILGPTGVGKTEISIQLAESLAGEIVSADSRLFYRGMDIGTAKPGLQDRLRVPHHLIDVTSPDQPWNLATFQVHAHQVILDIHSRRRLPLLVGGTGQYLRAVLEGWRLPQVEPDWRLRRILEGWAAQIGPNGLHHRLSLLDPKAAAGMDARNLRRTVRALEVIFTTGRRFSDQRLTGSSDLSALQVGLNLPHDELFRRIDLRIDRMMAQGLVAEVQSLLAQGYSPELPAFSAIGYRQIIAFLLGEGSLEQAVLEIKRATRVLVRRQANWFKSHNPDIYWFDLSLTHPSVILEHCQTWLRNIKRQ